MHHRITATKEDTRKILAITNELNEAVTKNTEYSNRIAERCLIRLENLIHPVAKVIARDVVICNLMKWRTITPNRATKITSLRALMVRGKLDIWGTDKDTIETAIKSYLKGV